MQVVVEAARRAAPGSARRLCVVEPLRAPSAPARRCRPATAARRAASARASRRRCCARRSELGHGARARARRARGPHAPRAAARCDATSAASPTEPELCTEPSPHRALALRAPDAVRKRHPRPGRSAGTPRSAAGLDARHREREPAHTHHLPSSRSTSTRVAAERGLGVRGARRRSSTSYARRQLHHVRLVERRKGADVARSSRRRGRLA